MIFWSMTLFKQDFIEKKNNTEEIVKKGICSILKIISSQIIFLPRTASNEKEKRNAFVYQLGNHISK